MHREKDDTSYSELIDSDFFARKPFDTMQPGVAGKRVLLKRSMKVVIGLQVNLFSDASANEYAKQ